MEDLGLLARDFGIRPQGKSAPMAASRSSATAGSVRSASNSTTWNKQRSGSSPEAPLFGGNISTDRIPPSYEDVFGGQVRKPSSPPSIDSIFEVLKDPAPKSSSLPVYDKPVYDDDIFVGVPGMKSSTSVKYVGEFASFGSAAEGASSPPYEDLLDSLVKGMPETKSSGEKRPLETKDNDLSSFEELLPGFGGKNHPQKRQEPVENHQKPAKTTVMPGDSFVELQTTSLHQSSGIFDDSLKHISQSLSSRSTNAFSSPTDEVAFDAFVELGKSVPLVSSGTAESKSAKIPYESNQNTSSYGYNFSEEPPHFVDTAENFVFKSQSPKSSESFNSGTQHTSQTSNVFDPIFLSDQSSKFHQHSKAVDVWLSVSEIPLFTKPSSAPPPSRPPPRITGKNFSFAMADEPASPGLNGRRKESDIYAHPNKGNSYHRNSAKRTDAATLDEFEDFNKVPQKYPNEHDVFTTEENIDANLRDAMGKAEAKLRHAKEVRERERDTKSSRNKDYASYQGIETPTAQSQYSEEKEKQEQLDQERIQRERDEKEEQQRKVEKERELEHERERERSRQAVERATREARERAAVEARQKAERAAAEKARQQADRLAFQRASAEARERAANEARDRAERAKATAEREKTTAETREKAAAEAREKASAEKTAVEARQRAAERAAVERVAAEARERAAADAKERAFAAAKEKQNKTDNDLEAFFGMGSRANSAPKQRAATPDNLFDSQFQNRGAPEAARGTSGSNVNIKKASSAANIADDLSSIFGASSSSGDFPEVDGETDERRRARLERHQRTLERAGKALAEKNERDMQMQRDQAERHRFGESLDFEIKRWAAGKDGNLRALLSTLHYVLWPDCGWQPVSLTDLITAAAVKKVYRKATLCIHPDKVQQKGATLQQKYIAEKVFDLLKEAWNKFNSEELF